MNMNNLGNGAPFEMLIHAGELDNLAGWSVENRFRDVRGELFGLWTDNGSAAVQLVLGPGRSDRREIVARYGLGYLGVWHSRGTWGTALPSSDDIDTARRIFETTLFSKLIISRVTLATAESENSPVSPLRFSGTKYRTIIDIAAFLVERDRPNCRSVTGSCCPTSVRLPPPGESVSLIPHCGRCRTGECPVQTV
ncbi:MAG: hypothetical protein JWN03_854 [Nocardia sp.]|uniref:hypothetical protein n=1 Tax=Nocardia sp. TaxID=1821 RepID=UPI00262CFE64|nr:hypothetical protein [Nocardia sp.]MCU1640579.1 hypothetical protein [Nocardia sp.]